MNFPPGDAIDHQGLLAIEQFSMPKALKDPGLDTTGQFRGLEKNQSPGLATGKKFGPGSRLKHGLELVGIHPRQFLEAGWFRPQSLTAETYQQRQHKPSHLCLDWGSSPLQMGKNIRALGDHADFGLRAITIPATLQRGFHRGCGIHMPGVQKLVR